MVLVPGDTVVLKSGAYKIVCVHNGRPSYEKDPMAPAKKRLAEIMRGKK